MKKLFDASYIVTRPFGFKDGYYTQYGFLGHEGTDFVPNSAQQEGANVYAICDGEVVRDTDDISQDPNWGAYGKKVVLWNKEKKIAFWYCHLKDNVVKLGQQVKEGDLIGHMGHSSIPGNVFGDHLHLNMAATDENGNRINQDNGYKGFIDPLPFVMQGGDQPGNVSVPSSTFENLVNKATKYDDFERAGYKTAQDVATKVGELTQSRDDYERDRDEWRGKAQHFEQFVTQLATILNSPDDEAEIAKVVTGLVKGEVGNQELKDTLLKTQADLAEASSQLDQARKTIVDVTADISGLKKDLQAVTKRAEKAEKTLEQWKGAKDEIYVNTFNVLGLILKIYTRR